VILKNRWLSDRKKDGKGQIHRDKEIKNRDREGIEGKGIKY